MEYLSKGSDRSDTKKIDKLILKLSKVKKQISSEVNKSFANMKSLKHDNFPILKGIK